MKVLGWSNFQYMHIRSVTNFNDDIRKNFISNILDRFNNECIKPISISFKEEYNQVFNNAFKDNYLKAFSDILNDILKLHSSFSYILINPLTVDKKHVRYIATNHRFIITENNSVYGEIIIKCITENIDSNEIVDEVTIYRLIIKQDKEKT